MSSLTRPEQIQGLNARAESLVEVASTFKADQLKRDYNSLTRDYKQLKLIGHPDGSTVRKALEVLKQLILEKEASGTGQSFTSRLPSLQRRCQPLTIDEVDMGLGFTGAGALALSYGVSASYAAVAWPISIAAFSILGAKKVYDSCCSRPAKVKVESAQLPVVSGDSSGSDTLRRRKGERVERKERDPVEQIDLRPLATGIRGMNPGAQHIARLGGRSSLMVQSMNLMERLKSTDGHPTFGLLVFGDATYAVRASSDHATFDIADTFAAIGSRRGERLSYEQMTARISHLHRTRHSAVREIGLLSKFA